MFHNFLLGFESLFAFATREQKTHYRWRGGLFDVVDRNWYLLFRRVLNESIISVGVKSPLLYGRVVLTLHSSHVFVQMDFGMLYYFKTSFKSFRAFTAGIHRHRKIRRVYPLFGAGVLFLMNLFLVHFQFLRGVGFESTYIALGNNSSVRLSFVLPSSLDTFKTFATVFARKRRIRSMHGAVVF